MLRLDYHLAKLGTGFNGRSEKLGTDECRAALDVEIKELQLRPGEVDQFHAGLSEILHNADGEPMFVRFKPLQLAKKIEGATVKLRDTNSDSELVLQDCNLARVRIEGLPASGVEVTLQVQLHPEAGDADWLAGRLNERIHVAIECQGYGEQMSLGEAA